jgi:hypothetical protein
MTIDNKSEHARVLKSNENKEFCTNAETLLDLTHMYIDQESNTILEIAHESDIDVSIETVESLLPIVCYMLVNILINMEFVEEEYEGRVQSVRQQREWVNIRKSQ